MVPSYASRTWTGSQKKQSPAQAPPLLPGTLSSLYIHLEKIQPAALLENPDMANQEPDAGQQHHMEQINMNRSKN